MTKPKAPFIIHERDLERRPGRYKSPLTHVGPVRSGTLREVEIPKPRPPITAEPE